MAASAGLLRKNGLPVQMCAFSAIGEFLRPLHRRMWRAVCAASEAPITRLPSPPSRARNAWDESKVLAWWIRRRFGAQRQVILDCSGAYAAVIAIAAKRSCPNLRIVHRMFGLEHEEFVYESGAGRVTDLTPEARRQYDMILNQLQCATRMSDAVVCVSEEMANYAKKNLAADVSRISVVPCCVDTRRFGRLQAGRAQLRKDLMIDGRFVVVYCGSFHRWQAPQKAAEIFSCIKSVEPRAHFLVLTTNPEQFRTCLHAAGILDSDLTVLSVLHAEVPRYLSTGDAGLLPRESTVVNSTASPVKFAEYLAAGLPVIISEGVGDYSACVQRENLGVVIRNDSEQESLRRQLTDFVRAFEGRGETFRDRCSTFANKHLSWDVRLPTLARVYESLI